MELPHSRLRQGYIEEIKVIEANIKDAANNETPQALFLDAQKKLDTLAERYQNSTEIGSAKYKLYELQALLHYFQHNDQGALDFIQEAIHTKGSSYKRAEQLIEKIEKNDLPKSTSGHAIFFHRSSTMVAIFSFVTFGLYSLYWSYKHWRAIRLSSGERTYPILSAIFQLFTTYPLFKRIRSHATTSGYAKFTRAGLAATGYLLMLFTLNSIWRFEAKTVESALTALFFILLLSAGLAAILAVVQRAANAHNITTLGRHHVFKKVFPGEIIFMVIAASLGILATVGMFASVGTVNMADLSSEARDAYQRMETLRSQHDTCSSELNTRYNNVDTTDQYAVDTYNSDLRACENIRLNLNQTVDEYNRLAGFTE